MTGTVTLIIAVRPPERDRALRLVVKRSSRATRSTFSRVSDATSGRPLSTRETVAIDTSAALATSLIVERLLPRWSSSDAIALSKHHRPGPSLPGETSVVPPVRVLQRHDRGLGISLRRRCRSRVAADFRQLGRFTMIRVLSILAAVAAFAVTAVPIASAGTSKKPPARGYGMGSGGDRPTESLSMQARGVGVITSLGQTYTALAPKPPKPGARSGGEVVPSDAHAKVPLRSIKDGSSNTLMFGE